MANKIKRGDTEMNVASLNFEVKTFGEPEDRTLRFIGSDETPDRDGDVISLDGWELDNYSKNPVFLWAHDYSIPPVGKATRVYQEGKKLLFDIEFPEKGVYPFADVVYNLYKGGFLNATSVGFTGKEAVARDDESVKDIPEWRRGVKFMKQELLELSAVPVPSNPAAIQQAKSLGAVTDDEYTSLMSFINGEFVTNPHVGAKTLKGIKNVYDAQENLDTGKEEKELEKEPKKEPEQTEPEQTEPEVQAKTVEDLVPDETELVVAASGKKSFILDVKSGKVIGDITEQIKSIVDDAVAKAIADNGTQQKAGASISKMNKSRLSQAKDLIIEVLGEVETDSSSDEEKDPSVLPDEEELNKPDNLDMDGKVKSVDNDDSKSNEPEKDSKDTQEEEFSLELLDDEDEVTIDMGEEGEE